MTVNKRFKICIWPSNNLLSGRVNAGASMAQAYIILFTVPLHVPPISLHSLLQNKTFNLRTKFKDIVLLFSLIHKIHCHNLLCPLIRMFAKQQNFLEIKNQKYLIQSTWMFLMLHSPMHCANAFGVSIFFSKHLSMLKSSQMSYQCPLESLLSTSSQPNINIWCAVCIFAWGLYATRKYNYWLNIT